MKVDGDKAITLLSYGTGIGSVLTSGTKGLYYRRSYFLALSFSIIYSFCFSSSLVGCVHLLYWFPSWSTVGLPNPQSYPPTKVINLFVHSIPCRIPPLISILLFRQVDLCLT